MQAFYIVHNGTFLTKDEIQFKYNLTTILNIKNCLHIDNSKTEVEQFFLGGYLFFLNYFLLSTVI